jgi:hypothetical protein
MRAQCLFWILIKVSAIDVDLFDNFRYLKDAIMQNSKTQEEVVWLFSSALSNIASSQIRKIKMDHKMHSLVRNKKLSLLCMWFDK